MIITAGQETIQALGIVEGQGGVQGVMCDTVQIMLSSIPTQEQLTALMAGAITDDGRSLQGYDGLTEVRLTLYRTPQDARDRAMQDMTAEVERRAEAERQAREAAEAALQTQAEAEQQREQAQEQVAVKSAQLMAVAEALPDDIAARHKDLYPTYYVGMELSQDQRFVHEDALYRVVQPGTHVSQEDWPPASTPAVYSRVPEVGDPQPWVNGSSYDTGVLVTNRGKTWESQIDGNVWEPGADGVYDNIWKEV